jgi:hypothetical protein
MNYQKPIDIDAHFKYKCPNKDCCNEHWLSLKEVSIANFKVVCEYCGIVFIPYRVVNICVRYATEDISLKKNRKIFLLKKYKKVPVEDYPTPSETNPLNVEPDPETETIDQTKKRFVETMKELGFDDSREVDEMFNRAYAQCQTRDIKTLFKIAVLDS